ncbi:hypothetical protein BU24DRAFT_424935 [Aaosphaeria arxii CBS 175.79]|uniref:Uncharacterized protein n=1 Tax=Aaosphaeria arxii CBS 175.79 TaxID=1450172 RepID=A0A6A5XM54_9PLEO|nr:uncharacterized protein BU24DRAFT_424935 [Aaosphaeria arxii CBS 175.79]KAF2013917.1 hypothetical protein BU24DRAFT_424935 [Aaosphaeria arxii CBS 175.79]
MKGMHDLISIFWRYLNQIHNPIPVTNTPQSKHGRSGNDNQFHFQHQYCHCPLQLSGTPPNSNYTTVSHLTHRYPSPQPIRKTPVSILSQHRNAAASTSPCSAMSHSCTLMTPGYTVRYGSPPAMAVTSRTNKAGTPNWDEHDRSHAHLAPFREIHDIPEASCKIISPLLISPPLQKNL